MSTTLATNDTTTRDLAAGVAAKVDNAIRYLAGVFSAKLIEDSRGALLTRIADYMREYGMTVGDVSGAFRRMASPEVSARIKFKSDVLAEFSAAVVVVMRERRDRDEAERRRREDAAATAYLESPAGRAERDAALKKLDEWKKSFGVMPGRAARPTNRGGVSGNQEGRGDRGRYAGAQTQDATAGGRQAEAGGCEGQGAGI